MSSLTHGTSGLALGYAAVAIPMAVTLFRRVADFGKAAASAAIAIPLTVAAGIANTVVSPLVHGLGIASGSFMESVVGLGVCSGIGYAAARAIARPGRPTSVHQRGTLVYGDDSDRRETSRPRGGITLAGLEVAPLDETKHFKLIGTTGTGKSTAIRELLAAALDRGDRAIIADPDGGYLDRKSVV